MKCSQENTVKFLLNYNRHKMFRADEDICRTLQLFKNVEGKLLVKQGKHPAEYDIQQYNNCYYFANRDYRGLSWKWGCQYQFFTPSCEFRVTKLVNYRRKIRNCFSRRQTSPSFQPHSSVAQVYFPQIHPKVHQRLELWRQATLHSVKGYMYITCGQVQK